MAFVSGEGALPSIRISPLVGVSRPLASLMRVVLPLPFGPSRPTDAARLDGKLHALEGGLAAVALGERLTF